MARRRLGGMLCAAAAVLLWAGCGDEGGTPRLLVDLVTDLQPGTEFAAVRTSYDGPGGSGEERMDVSGAEAFGRGARVAEFVSVRPGNYRVRVELLDPAGEVRVQRTVAVRVADTRVVRVVVTRNCVGVSCPEAGDSPEATECLGGRCVPPECGGDGLERCGEAQCEADAPCAPFPGACRGRCEQGACLDVPREGACADGERCGEEGRCVPFEGPGDAAVDTGAGEDAGVDAGSEGGTDAGPDARVDAGPDADAGPVDPCPGGCDDGNPCTVDRCTEAGCEHDAAAADGEVCDDGVYCNGSDQCSGGSCSVHAGDPCGGSTSCDEAMDRCVGCRSDADCPGPMEGPWSACTPGGASGDALCSGTQEQSVTTYRCDTARGECVGNTTTRSRSCAASEGDACGDTTTRFLTACDYSSVCDETGSRVQRVTSYVCASGTCTAMDSDRTVACTRDTDGTMCGATMTGTWGSCRGFTSTCDETGTQSRTVTSYSCVAGSCRASTSTEMQPCTRDTDGTNCDDGLFCTDVDTCSGGSCSGSGSPCSGVTPLCDETSDRCVACFADSDCSGVTPYCVNNRCVQCRSNSDCRTGYLCIVDFGFCERDCGGVPC